jgi:hypothetical protein
MLQLLSLEDGAVQARSAVKDVALSGLYSRVMKRDKLGSEHHILRTLTLPQAVA